MVKLMSQKPIIKHILKQFMRREASPVIQFVKYGIAGGIATGVHILSFYCLACLIFPALKADDIVIRILDISVMDISDMIRARNAMIDNAIAFILSNLVAYLLNIIWVFEPGRHHRAIEISLFFLVSGVSLAIGSGLMGALIKYLSLSTTSAFIAVVVSSTLINFILRKYLIFKH